MSATHTALDDGQRAWSYEELTSEVARVAELLTARGVRVLASQLDNSPAWVVTDLAAARAGVVHVPLPLFFSPAQTAYALQAAQVDACLLQEGAPAPANANPQRCTIAGRPLQWHRRAAEKPALPPDTVKITFTSGTTGTPKGVCLDAMALRCVTHSLLDATAALDIRRHLCALPLAVLLENVAGLLAPLARGATCIVPPLQEVGLAGSSSFDPARLHAAVVRHAPHSLILLPQMLRAWTIYLQRSKQRAPASLKLVAVGGAAVGERLLQAARAAGIPAYEGYGLSEGASVQTLNLPGADRPGSAGRVLPHARLRIAADGEIEVAGSLFAGYLGDAAPPPAWWPTGDLGRIDEDGYLHLQGRKKNVLITAYGRNVSPEWVETALRADDAIAQAVVFGDGQPALAAVLWPLQPQLGDAALQAAVDAANAGQPDYARIARWVRARAPFDAASGLATANGRPQRAAIHRLHADALDATGAFL